MKQKKSKGSKSAHSRAKSTNGPGMMGANARAAMREGQGMQEQWMRNMAAAMDRGASIADWQVAWTRLAQAATNAMPLAQRQFQDVMQMVATNSRTGAELLRKTIEVSRMPMLLQTQDRWMELWATSLRAMQTNAQTFSQVAGRSLTSYIELMRKNLPFAEMAGSKA